MTCSSYPTIYALGHRAIAGIFDAPVLVEEKIDGSQFSFGVFDGELRCRSKGAQICLESPEKMFAQAIRVMGDLRERLHPGWTYRAEYLLQPKHGTLAYQRIPSQHLIIFDISPSLEAYLPYQEKLVEAHRLGLEVVPMIYEGMVTDPDMFKAMLETVSILGGQKIEGVVVKNYALFTAEKKVAIGKYVSESFKEIHAGEWRKSNPNPGDIVHTLIARYRTPARWTKAVQHLRDAGNLEESPRDIGALMREVPLDVERECAEDISAALWEWAWPKLRRGLTDGLPDWYKQRLLEQAFSGVGGRDEPAEGRDESAG